MKTTFNKYWIIIALVIILNVLIFKLLSERLEKYIAEKVVDNQLSTNNY